jgi:hypothetical protein
VRGVVLDLAAQLQRGLELRPDPYAGGDFLGEDLLAADAVRFQGIELGLEFLGEVRAAGVAYPDISARFFPSTTVTPLGPAHQPTHRRPYPEMAVRRRQPLPQPSQMRRTARSLRADRTLRTGILTYSFE